MKPNSNMPSFLRRVWFGSTPLAVVKDGTAGAILLLVYAHHNWLADFNSPPVWWQTAYGLAFAMFSAATTFTVPAVFLRFARSSFWLLDAMRPSAYGIYLLHFIFLIWLQYIVYDPAFPVSSNSRSCSPVRFR